MWRCSRGRLHPQVVISGRFLANPSNQSGTDPTTSSPIVIKWLFKRISDSLSMSSLGYVDTTGQTITTMAPAFPRALFQSLSGEARSTTFLLISFNSGVTFSTFASLTTEVSGCLFGAR